MGYVYRYTDLSDNIIKYIGTIWSPHRTLGMRIKEHQMDDWVGNKKWKIEYLEMQIESRTDAEYIEAHFISLFGTGEYYNKKKKDWGISNFIPKDCKWIEYSGIEIKPIHRLGITSEVPMYIISLLCNGEFEVSEKIAYKTLCKKHENDKHNVYCWKCGSNEVIRRNESNKSNGQIYCENCGAWVKHADYYEKKIFTPKYNGKYLKTDGEIDTYYQYIVPHRRSRYWDKFISNKNESLMVSCVSEKNTVYAGLDMYIENENNIIKGQNELIRIYKEDKEKKILLIQNKISDLSIEIEREKDEYEYFLSKAKQQVCL